MERFYKLPQRDQVLLVVLALVLLCYCLYKVAWSPLISSNHVLKRHNQVTYEELVEVRRLAEQYSQLRSDVKDRSLSERSFSKIIDKVTNKHQMRMERFQPGANGDIKIRFNNVSFDSLVYWINELENEHGVSIRELSILPGSDSNLVKVSVKLYMR